MIGRLLRGSAALLAYFAIATLLAQLALLAFVWSTGRLDRDKLSLMIRAAQGNLPAASATQASSGNQTRPESFPSLASIEDARAIKLRQLELREEALTSGLPQLEFELSKLTGERARLETTWDTLNEKLAADKANAIADGNENARLLLESIRPSQSKELILMMLEAEEIDDVVTLFSAMPIAKRAKIVAEFREPRELDQLDEILRRIRSGLPQTALIDEAQRQLRPPDPGLTN